MRFLGRYFARAVVRRIAYVLAAAVVGSVLQMCTFNAHAVDMAPCTAVGSCDEGEAYANADAYATAANYCKGAGTWTFVSKRIFRYDSNRYAAAVTCKRASDNYQAEHLGAGQAWFFGARTCSARNSANPPGDTRPWYTEPAKCIGGCQITGQSFTESHGGVKVYGQTSRYYTGQTCSKPTGQEGIGPDGDNKEDQQKPKPDECVALGSGQTACTKPNGNHCATASTGKTFCWEPGQEGSQADGPEGQRKSEQGKPVAPPDQPPPPDKDWQRSEGHQSEICQGASCKSYNMTNFTTVPAGTSKNSSGDNSNDGTKNTSGNGKPGAGGGGDGDSKDGDSASDSGNCDQAPACTGDTLKCLHLKFTWKIQCNTKGSEISGGDGCGNGDVPVCAGSSCKAEAYAQLLQQWRGRCSVENALKGVEQQAGQGDGGDGKVGIIIEDSGNGLALDEGKIAYGSGQLGYSFDVQGVQFQIPQQVLDFLPILRMLIIAGASLAAIAIIRGNG